MASLPVTSHPTPSEGALNDCLHLHEPANATVLPADAGNGEEPDFDETHLVCFEQNENFQGPRVLQTQVGHIETDSHSLWYLLCNKFGPHSLPSKQLLQHIWHIHHTSLISASNRPINLIREVRPFVLTRDLHICVHFTVMYDLGVLLLVGTCFVDRFVRGIIPMQRRIVPIWSCQVTINSKCLLRLIAGSITLGSRRWDHYWRATGQLRRNTAVRSRSVCQNTLKMQKSLYQSRSAAPDSCTMRHIRVLQEMEWSYWAHEL